VQLVDDMLVPLDWRVSGANLCDSVGGYEFLFSKPVLDGLRLCTSADDLARLLTQAFEDLSHRQDRDWRPMGIFVLAMAVGRALYQTAPYTTAARGEQVTALQRMRGMLLRRYRTYAEERRQRTSALIGHISYLRGEVRKQAEQAQSSTTSLFDLNDIVSSESQVRSAVFREMIELA
jgi:hypothetical protein